MREVTNGTKKGKKRVKKFLIRVGYMEEKSKKLLLQGGMEDNPQNFCYREKKEEKSTKLLSLGGGREYRKIHETFVTGEGEEEKSTKLAQNNYSITKPCGEMSKYK